MAGKERQPGQTAQKIREAQEGTKELQEFGRKLLPYYHRFMDYAAAAVNDPSLPQPEQMRERGLHYRSQRRQHGLSRDEVSQRLGIHPVQLAAFESGLIPETAMPEEFTKNLVNVLQAHPLKGGV